MTAPKTCLPRATHYYRFLPTNHSHANDSMMFELDESDIWNTATREASPEYRRQTAIVSRKSSVAGTRITVGSPASLPVNVPDWSKILKDEYRENRTKDSDDDFEDDGAGETGDWVPPHEFLARQMARTRIGSFSVHEGIGRTLKGRDLRRVRNAIWQKTGFQD